MVDRKHISRKINRTIKDIIPNQTEILVKVNDPEVSYKDFPTIKHSKYSQSLLKIFSADGYDKNSSHKSVMQLKNEFYAELKATQ